MACRPVHERRILPGLRRPVLRLILDLHHTNNWSRRWFQPGLPLSQKEGTRRPPLALWSPEDQAVQSRWRPSLSANGGSAEQSTTGRRPTHPAFEAHSLRGSPNIQKFPTIIHRLPKRRGQSHLDKRWQANHCEAAQSNIHPRLKSETIDVFTCLN